MNDSDFPILSVHGEPTAQVIPYVVAERTYDAWRETFGVGWTLERVRQHGGFDPGELSAFLPGWTAEVTSLDWRALLCGEPSCRGCARYRHLAG